MMDTTFQGHTATGKDEWLTPPEILGKLGKFDLDPCSPIDRPWPTATHHYTVKDDGLSKDWFGRVWCNPPYGNALPQWLDRCANHGDCMALVFARTETKAFFDYIWNRADAVLFIKGRLKFHHVDGRKGDSAGAPSVLVAYGRDNADLLSKCNIDGKYIRLKI